MQLGEKVSFDPSIRLPPIQLKSRVCIDSYGCIRIGPPAHSTTHESVSRNFIHVLRPTPLPTPGWRGVVDEA